jgi:hypothetical protein
MQELIVAAIVIASAVYAVWSLMPAAWRKALLRRVGRTPAPAGDSGGCGGCGGCGSDLPRSAAPASAVITVHRRPPAA